MVSDKENNPGNTKDSEEHFQNLSPKTSTNFDENQKLVERVGWLKKSVPVLTVIVLIILILIPLLSQKENSFTLAVDRLEKRDENAKLTNPNYVGRDQYNNPVIIGAETAYRKSNDEKDYFLRDLLAAMTLKSGHKLDLSAQEGVFDASAQEMRLTDKIVITTEHGYLLNSGQALFLINDKIATGESGIVGEAPYGNFSADGFFADMDNEIIRLEGNVKMHFDQGKKAPSSTQQTSGTPQ